MGSTVSQGKKQHVRRFSLDAASTAYALCRMLDRAEIKTTVKLVERKIPATPDTEPVFQVTWEV